MLLYSPMFAPVISRSKRSIVGLAWFGGGTIINPELALNSHLPASSTINNSNGCKEEAS